MPQKNKKGEKFLQKNIFETKRLNSQFQPCTLPYDIFHMGDLYGKKEMDFRKASNFYLLLLLSEKSIYFS